MQPAQQGLLDRILASPHFANTLTLGKILSYLCEKTAGTDTRIKEHEIATEVLRRNVSFDPKLDPVVRVSMSGIRERLQQYFDDAGQSEPLRLAIPKGQYRAEFTETKLQSIAGSLDGAKDLKEFWGQYLTRDRSSLIVHTEPLFFREGWETYVRDLYVNDVEKGYAQLIDRLPELRTRTLTPSYHYLDAGEINCMFLFMQFFHDMGLSVGVRNARIASWHELRNSNLVLVGCTRTNPFMDMLQEENDFVIGEDEIRNLRPREGELPSYSGKRYQDSKLPRYREYVLVTRRPGACKDTTMTMLAANHGRAIEGAANFLTSSREVSNLCSTMKAARVTGLPERFQILLKVEMIDVDDEILDVQCVSYRV